MMKFIPRECTSFLKIWLCLCNLNRISVGLGDRPKSTYKDPDDGRQRFLLELEFIQCLANPTYIHCKLLFSLLEFTIRSRA